MKKGQISQLIDIQKEYNRLVDEHKGIVFVEVTVDREPGEKGRDELLKKLSKASGKQVKMKGNVRPEILGGMIIRQGDVLIDNSIKKALEGAVERIKGITRTDRKSVRE
jgi:F-type H+-transporting ATPase subunit delta